MNRRPAAVVVGGDLNGLGVVRSLARAGIPAFMLDTDLSKPTMRTRFGRKRRIAALSGSGLIDSLLQLRETLDADPVLFLTQEASVATVSAARERLAAYRFRMAPHEIMQALLDKVLFQQMAEAGGFPIPKSVHLSRGEDSQVAVAGLRFPCVLKPTTKHPEYGKHFQKAYRLESAADVEPLWSKMRAVVDEMIVQEWIEGDDTDVYFCLQYRADAERAAASFVGRKLHQWPPLVGGTAFCMAAPEVAEELSECTDAFFRHAGFRGMGSMEFKRDRRDGTFYMIEPTVGRTDYQEEIATLNGMNIPAVAYHVESGKPFPLVLTKNVHSQGWRDPLGYANARKAGVPDASGPFAQDIKVWDAYFRPGDPMPAMALKARGLLRRFRRKAI